MGGGVRILKNQFFPIILCSIFHDELFAVDFDQAARYLKSRKRNWTERRGEEGGFKNR